MEVILSMVAKAIKEVYHLLPLIKRCWESHDYFESRSENLILQENQDQQGLGNPYQRVQTTDPVVGLILTQYKAFRKVLTVQNYAFSGNMAFMLRKVTHRFEFMPTSMIFNVGFC